MNLSEQDGRLFYKLHPALLCHVNRTLGVLPEQPATPEQFLPLSPEKRLKVRDALGARPELVDTFVAANPFAFAETELEIVRSWKHAVFGGFYAFRYLAKYTVFLSDGDPRRAYGVLGLADHPEDLLGPHLPRLVRTALLPFRGKIVYDGLLSSYNIFFGGGVKRHLNEDYRQAKEAFGIITSLPFAPERPMTALSNAAGNAKKRPRNAATARALSRSPSQVETKLTALIELTDAFCKEFLNEEYARLCRKLAAALARKRPSPLLRGRLEPWASGIVRSIGSANFLGDATQTPHMKSPCIDRAFGVGESTGHAKAKSIREMFNIRPLAPQWTVPSRMDDNPLVWMVEVNGLIMDMRRAPREYQEAAFRRGLIPYIPADRGDAGDD